MKKYLSLIGALALGTTSSLTVIACGNKSTPKPTPKPGTKNIIQWSNQTSNIAKSLILSKNGNFNTNRLLNNVLNDNNSNIKTNNSEDNGSSYDKFKSIWGYKNNIAGITAKDFISNNANTIDNNQAKTRDTIAGTINQIQSYVNIVASLPSFLITNSFLADLINRNQNAFSNILWTQIHSQKDTIAMIKQLLPLSTTIINNLDAFNPEQVLGKDYHKDDIAKSLFGENGNDGWLSHYKTTTGFSSEAVAKNSSILQQKNFTTWDQVALFKTSIDLNGFIYSLGNKTLGEIFNSAIQYDKKGEAVAFDLGKFASEILTIWTSSPKNIINLIATLIPIIKYQFFGINPTTAITKISTTEKSDKAKGIINIKDIFSKIEEILLTKDGFTNFITTLFFAKSKTEFNLSNYATFDFTCKNKSLTETLFPLKDNIIANINNIYTAVIQPAMKKAYVPEIINNIKKELAALTTNFELPLTNVKEILNIITGIFPFLDKITSYKNKQEILDDWTNLWATLGIQDQAKKDFIKGSFLDQAKQFITTNPKFLSNVANLLSSVAKITTDSINLIIKQETTTNIDFNNEKLWTVDETTVEFIYDKTRDETTIFYSLIDKTKTGVTTTYKVSVVVQGNGDTDLGTTKHQVWLKSLSQG